jgi:D-glycero-D-manno-heptose 1,7-bisphosphate phosphatase
LTNADRGERVGAAVRSAVFLDRDGVINRLVRNPATGLLESPYRPEDVELTPRAVDAIRLLRTLGLPLVGISNQPAAAKGTCDLETLHAVHEEVARLLVEAEAGLDDYRYCFHHPDGSVSELTQVCTCRKPAPGMITAACESLGGCDLARSWVVGDSDVDVEAGRAVGCRTMLVEEPGSAHRRSGNAAPDERARDLYEAAAKIARASERGG